MKSASDEPAIGGDLPMQFTDNRVALPERMAYKQHQGIQTESIQLIDPPAPL
jgi:hypothetical protein